ncbi:hypothetical protein [Shimia thalassica]|uniref:hypothetical protein n=1 Tax=Shimia thalassica TaxID=1715693 RepID=UPI0026E2E596|nr:hypothetical protein [Shimia thalassica]MDO6799348.1 hypothetical protein [Shimia thalassica]
MLQLLDDGDFGKIRRSVYVFSSLQFFIFFKDLHLKIPLAITDTPQNMPATVSPVTASYILALIVAYLLAHLLSLIPSEFERYRREKISYNQGINNDITNLRAALDTVAKQTDDFQSVFASAHSAYIDATDKQAEFLTAYDGFIESTKKGISAIRRADMHPKDKAIPAEYIGDLRDELTSLRRTLATPLRDDELEKTNQMFIGIKTQLINVNRTIPKVTEYLNGLRDANSRRYRLIFYGQFFSKLILNIFVPIAFGASSLFLSFRTILCQP